MASRTQPPQGIPLIAPGDFRRVAIASMADRFGAKEAESRYADAIASAPDALSRALTELQRAFPAIALDFSAEALGKLDAALARKRRTPRPPEDLVDGVGAYLGETLRVVVRGRWVVRYDPTGGRGLQASTLHFDPGVAGHSGYESAVFQVARDLVSRKPGAVSLSDHLAGARALMEGRGPEPTGTNGLGLRRSVIR
jgi:hypothetical protein